MARKPEACDHVTETVGSRHAPVTPPRPSRPLKSPAQHSPATRLKPGGKFDLVMFWKQNDTGLYGRRHDMFIKYLSRHERIGRIIQFDAPMDARALEALPSTDDHAQFTEHNLVYATAVRRHLHLDDRGTVFKRTFVYDNAGGAIFKDQPLPRKSDYPEFVRTTVEQLSSGLPAVAWVCPVVYDFPEIEEAVGFDLTIADLIDDARTMTGNPERRALAETSYRTTLAKAGVVMTNCEPNRTVFKSIHRDIALVPNACELFPDASSWARPEELSLFERPLIGYVGNLRSRIDIALLRRVASEFPEASILLVGSAHGDSEALRLRDLPNVHLLGVRPYDEAVRIIRHLDVALMPHVRNAVSDQMNPLKLYVYASLGVPVVTTAVQNIREAAKFAVVARNGDQFIDAIRGAIAKKKRRFPRASAKQLHAFSWERRVDQVFRLIDGSLRGRRKTAKGRSR